MKASEAIIAWNALDDFRSEGRPGSIAVGPLLYDGDGDWTRPYLYTGGAAEVHRRTLSDRDQQFFILRDFYTLVYVYGLHPDLVHKAFMHIDEYQDIAEAAGALSGKSDKDDGPKREVGHREYPVAAIEERRVGRSFHFWPAG